MNKQTVIKLTVDLWKSIKMPHNSIFKNCKHADQFVKAVNSATMLTV